MGKDDTTDPAGPRYGIPSGRLQSLADPERLVWRIGQVRLPRAIHALWHTWVWAMPVPV